MALRDGWHLDKRVPIALIVTLVAYGVTFLWQFAELRADVDNNTQDITEIKQLQVEVQREANNQSNQLSAIQTEIIGLRRDINRFLDNQNK